MAEKTVTRVQFPNLKPPELIPVAAYARVSLESERLAHSLSAQISYYSDLIQKTPGWRYAGVYADEFVTGTRIDKRSEFQRMLKDCEAGRIKIILCKSVSRFARNCVDLLSTVRRLRELGVEIRFEKEGLSTMSQEGELMLSLLAVFSEQESVSISDNVKWGLRKRFQNGTIHAANKHLLGYRYDGEKYVVIPEEAEIVRSIFHMYLDGLSLQAICDELNEKGYRTTNGNLFHEASLNNLIHNEIYAGDIRRQKTFIENPVSKVKVINRGQLPQFYADDAHEPILDRETWEKVQAEAKRRSTLLPQPCVFSGFIICGRCGRFYSRNTHTGKGKRYISWVCRAKKEAGITCDSPNYAEKELKAICCRMLEMEAFDEEKFSSAVESMIVQPNGDIQFILTTGEDRTWHNPHLTDWRHEPTSTDAFAGKIRCADCGNTYHRVNSAGRWIYWYCIGKKRKNCACQAVNYPDQHLRRISAYVMGTDEFDEQAFTERVDHIVAQPDGTLVYHFTDGSVKQWKKQ